jgi:hypothetical protein
MRVMFTACVHCGEGCTSPFSLCDECAGERVHNKPPAPIRRRIRVMRKTARQ